MNELDKKILYSSEKIRKITNQFFITLLLEIKISIPKRKRSQK